MEEEAAQEGQEEEVRQDVLGELLGAAAEGDRTEQEQTVQVEPRELEEKTAREASELSEESKSIIDGLIQSAPPSEEDEDGSEEKKE